MGATPMSKEFDQRVTDFFAHYQDRGMKKWAGFVQGYAEDKVVIGEHVIALDDLRCVLLLSD